MARKVNIAPVITIEDKQAADRQIKDRQKQIDYDTKDFTIELLVEKFKKKDFFIPLYQRKFIWQENNKNLFLESIFLGLPIPFMFLADCEDGRMEIIDGAQRMQTIVEFCKNEFRLTHLEKLSALKGFCFKDLSEAQQRKFLNKYLRIVILGENTPSESRQDLFYRVNTTGIKASDAEIRRGSYAGAFTDFIAKCSKNDLFLKLVPISKKREDRYERFEFVLRFFAYINEYETAWHHVNSFLDDYLTRNIDSFDEKFFEAEFEGMLHFVENTFPNGFSKSSTAKSTPRVRFEAIAVGVGLALRKQPNLRVDNVKWLDSHEFQQYTTSDGSNNEGRLKQRVEYVRDQLLKG